MVQQVLVRESGVRVVLGAIPLPGSPRRSPSDSRPAGRPIAFECELEDGTSRLRHTAGPGWRMARVVGSLIVAFDCPRVHGLLDEEGRLISGLRLASDCPRDGGRYRVKLVTPVTGLTSCHEAARRGDAARIKSCALQEINARTKGNLVTPLHEAAEWGHCEAIAVLVERGARLDAQLGGDWLETPLHRAAQFGRAGAVNQLLDFGAEVDMRDKSGGTPLWHAMQNGLREISVALLRRGAHPDPSVRCALRSARMDDSGRFQGVTGQPGVGLRMESATIAFVATPLFACACHDWDDLAEALLVGGARVNGAWPEGPSPLSVAAGYENMKFVQQLLARGAELETVFGPWMTPLIEAIGARRVDIMRVLRDAGASISKRSPVPERGWVTPLYMAAALGYDDGVRFLLASGAEAPTGAGDLRLQDRAACSSYLHDRAKSDLANCCSRLGPAGEPKDFGVDCCGPVLKPERGAIDFCSRPSERSFRRQALAGKATGIPGKA